MGFDSSVQVLHTHAFAHLYPHDHMQICTHTPTQVHATHQHMALIFTSFLCKALILHLGDLEAGPCVLKIHAWTPQISPKLGQTPTNSTRMDP